MAILVITGVHVTTSWAFIVDFVYTTPAICLTRIFWCSKSEIQQWPSHTSSIFFLAPHFWPFYVQGADLTCIGCVLPILCTKTYLFRVFWPFWCAANQEPQIAPKKPSLPTEAFLAVFSFILWPFWHFFWVVYSCRDNRPHQSVHGKVELRKRRHCPLFVNTWFVRINSDVGPSHPAQAQTACILYSIFSLPTTFFAHVSHFPLSASCLTFTILLCALSLTKCT